MRVSVLSIFVFSVLLTCSCGKEDEISSFRINHFKQAAVGLEAQLVFQIQEGDNIGSNEWEFLYSPIDGFNYEWGYIYDLQVKKETVDDPPADGSSIKYTLEKIIAKEKVGEDASFEITLKSEADGVIPSLLWGDVSIGFQLHNEIEVDCGDFCLNLQDLLTEKNEVVGTFKHTDEGKLILMAVDTD